MTKRQWLLSFCCAGMVLGCSENGSEKSINCPGGCNDNPAPECEKTQKDCREDGADAAVCVDVRNDHTHCGDCHLPCKSNETCLSGTCIKNEDLPECGELSPCVLEDGSYACFDLNVDRDHCGRCETFCNDGENCINGTCKGAENTSCGDGLSACPVGDGEQCFDLLTDGMHCGRCDIACGADETCVSGVCKPASFTLRTKNATLELSLSGNDILVNSLKSVGGKEYLPASQALTLPDCGDTLKFQSVEKYSRGRTMDGLKFHYTGSGFDYDLYIVSSESFSGPFEFYGYLTNKGEKRRVTPGNYFNLAVKFPAVPTATVFHKESGSAEGWKIYDKTPFEGSGIYRTSLGKVGSSNTGSSAKIPRSDYSAIYFWTGLKDTSEHVITFYARGKQGESFNYDYEAAYENGASTPAVEYGVSGSYTFKNSDVWEPVTLHLTSNYPAGSNGEEVLNEEHANRGFPFRIYTTQATGNPFWIDEVTINGRTQSFNGNTPDEGWEWGSWTPSNNISIDKSMGYGDATSGYASAIAAYTTNQDWNAGGDISMMYLDTNESGLYFAQEWSNGRLTASGADGNQAHLNALIGNGDFSTSLTKGQVLYLPSIYIGVYDGDIDIGSNHFKRWFLNCKAPENMMKDANEPLTQQDMQIGYDVSQYGIQSIKWDYGWWSDEVAGKDGKWRTHEGLLEVNDSKYKSVLSDAGAANLGEFVNKVKSKGVTLAIYILLKDTEMDRADVPTSVGANGHPEWFSDRIVTVGASADLGNTDCVAFYKKYLSEFFKSTGVTTWRSDFEPIARSSNKANRHDANGTDVQYWCTVGFGELVDHLIQNIPGFRYESCSSGGSMKDLFTMTKASVLNCDDSADYMSLHMTFYDSSYCIHPAQLQLPINSQTYKQDSKYYTGSADYMYGLRTQMTGGVMLTNPDGPKDGEKKQWKTTIAVDYNTKLKPLIRNGDLYHILGRPDGKNWDGLEYVDLTAPTYVAAVMLWKPAGASASKTVKLRGLDANAKYKLNFTDHTGLNGTKTGKELMESGLSVNFPETVSSDIIYLTRE
ncbi:MAG: GH36 C-terminal domain-containing protein [Proteobacteria bacterium]|nr:GH36 C-terminal domain-containing protein [Pseudomonadota bacterium]